VPEEVHELVAGDPLVLTTCGGIPGNGVGLFLMEVNGLSFPGFLQPGAFDGAGVWPVFCTVPPGMEGTRFTLQRYSRGNPRGGRGVVPATTNW
jgi:hypothetical protein